MNIYYNDNLIGLCSDDINEATKIMRDFLNKKHVNYTESYWRWVGLDDNRTMVDFGSWDNFFYVDCPSELLFKHDKTRSLPVNKRKEPRRKNKTSL